MSDPVAAGAERVVDAALEAAFADIRAAIESVSGGEAGQVSAAETAGHGTIRLRGRPDGPGRVTSPPPAVVAAAADQVGRGT